jgi:flagellar biosynthesis/type III secretory pathway protein FliH
MSTYDRILAKGIEQGREQGIEQATKKAIINGFDKGLSISMICNINELTDSYVVKILQENKRII